MYRCVAVTRTEILPYVLLKSVGRGDVDNCYHIMGRARVVEDEADPRRVLYGTKYSDTRWGIKKLVFLYDTGSMTAI